MQSFASPAANCSIKWALHFLHGQDEAHFRNAMELCNSAKFNARHLIPQNIPHSVNFCGISSIMADWIFKIHLGRLQCHWHVSFLTFSLIQALFKSSLFYVAMNFKLTSFCCICIYKITTCPGLMHYADKALSIYIWHPSVHTSFATNLQFQVIFLIVSDLQPIHNTGALSWKVRVQP